MSDEDLETFRHRCEVRWLLQKFARDGKEAGMKWLEEVRRNRGDECADRLLEDARTQRRLGNTGFEKGEWRT